LFSFTTEVVDNLMFFDSK